MTNAPEIFETQGCVQLEKFLDVDTTRLISRYMENRINRKEWVETYEGELGSSKYFYYADPLIESMLVACLPAIEKVTGRELLPSYTYSRVYQAGEELKPHVDRPACEVSVTVNIANKGGVSPIYMQYGGNPPSEHMLNPGDAVVYKGCEAKHWRTPLQNGQLNVQFMLHYVDKNGPFAAHHLDKRESLGLAR